ncbi:hypothetical protein NWP22_08790 [Anabaenopsis tanganyikae CS-531]|uniref:Uncharacterized protein n=1 Tax=Anabaenopsis tanganyikae CS-531 TaxID=2785304 RepID=A0ABT6KF35_9CYAN|nr:hypothetical protein [Anabaenopsis tanganyikae]MDH6105959.1 hypothetical protein [Anabaenopsis tanganyikae CS-531]
MSGVETTMRVVETTMRVVETAIAPIPSTPLREQIPVVERI